MPQVHTWSYSVRLPPDPSNVADARDFVADRLQRHGLSHLVPDLSVVVSELVTNAITHAGTVFTVALEKSGSSLTVSVTDRTPAVPVKVEAEVSSTGGRGLVLVDVLSRDWGVVTHTGGSKTVWADFLLDDALTPS